MSAPKMGTDTWPEPSEMLARARAMIPALKTRALETENTGKLHADTVAELHKTGLFRMVQPARVGGGDYDYNLMLEVTMELGRGCGSTAWVFINLACHHWMLGMWPPEGQDHVWSENADALIASSVIYPAGRAEKTDGGYALSGRWPFCSGIDHSDWVM
ncbi:MAG: acyl-CoA dehydrogenase family protein, partial [Rhodospirillales bacterium]|nr:acyl-CoA dehydrogenase family protein [Rhodospirillales bacterium]